MSRQPTFVPRSRQPLFLACPGPASVLWLGACLLYGGPLWALEFTGDDRASGSLSSADGDIHFREQSSAGGASIDNPVYFFGTWFHDQSSAGNASIDNTAGGFTRFAGQSTAGNASIAADSGSYVMFDEQSSAGSATLMVDGEAGVFFSGNSTAGNARLIAGDSGYFDFSESSGVAGDGRLTAGSIEGSGAFYLGSITLVVGSNNLDTSLDGLLEGDVDGSLVKVGSGTLSIGGDNSKGFASAIRVEEGLLNFTSSAALGSGSITLDGGGLQWAAGNSDDLASRLAPLGSAGGVFDTNGNDVLLTSALGGSGGLSKRGGGVLELHGPASYAGITRIDAGTLRQGQAGALASGGAYVIEGGTLDLNGFDLSMSSLSGTGGTLLLTSTLTLDQASDSQYAGAIGGAGSLLKRGGGTLSLSGSNSFFGSSEVQAGTLVVDGSLASAVQVRSGGVLAGTGRVGSVSLDSGGMLAPGNSIGTLQVDGDLLFASGATYQVEVDAAGNADQLQVGGLASLAGTLQVLAENGSYAPETQYSILTASGESPIVGTFDGVSSNLAFLDPSLSYADNEVILTLMRNDISFVSRARTPNQRAFARAAQSLDSDNEVYRTLLDLGEDEVGERFDRLSGDAHASFASALVFDDLNLMRAPLGNLRRNLNAPERALPYWVQVGGGRQRIEDDGNAGQVIQDHQGMLFGGDWPVFGDWRLGGAFGYGEERLQVDSREAKADSDSYRYALYGGRDIKLGLGSLKLFGGGGYSQHQIDSRRSVQLIDGPQQLTRDYDLSTAQAFGELAWHVKLGEPAYLEPFVGLLNIEQRSDSFAEQGGAAALSAGSQRNQLLSTTLGMRGQQLFKVAERDLLLNGSFTWRQLNGDLRPELELQLAGGDRFKVFGSELPRNSFLLELNADYSITPNIVLDVDYNGVFSNSSQANNIAFNLRWKM